MNARDSCTDCGASFKRDDIVYFSISGNDVWCHDCGKKHVPHGFYDLWPNGALPEGFERVL